MEKMSKEQVMMHFEHRMLPAWFYGDPRDFANVVCTEKDALFNIVNELFSRAGLENPYKPEQFSVEPDEVNKSVAMVRIKFPKPERTPLCHSAICFFDKGFSKLKYFTLEMGEDIDAGFPILCTWTEKGEHFTSGKTSLDPDEQLIECIDMYMSRYGEEISEAYGH